jgi:formate dehydrogenase major subunit
MTQHWVDLKNADVIMVIGSNMAENHPMGMKHVQKAIDNGATLISVDPRFTRTSAKAHIYAALRSGTDIAFIGGMIKYAIDNNLYNDKYVKECTNALLKVRTDFKTCAEAPLGIFSGLTGGTYSATLDATLDASYGAKTTWEYDFGDQAWQANWPFVLGDIVRPTTSTNYHYECTVAGTSGPLEPSPWPTVVGNVYVDGTVTWKCIYKKPKLAANLTDSACVFQLLKKQFDGYTIAKVCEITGTDPVVYEQICEKYCETRFDDKSGTICYALGTTQHTHGVQNIRAYSILQLLLGNMGIAGGGVNAMRGQDNVQGATDQAVLFNYLPGYLRTPINTDASISAYCLGFHDPALAVDAIQSYTVRGTAGVNPGSDYWWKNANKYITSLTKAWWPTVDHNTAFHYFPKKAAKATDYSLLSLMHAINAETIKGLYSEGVNLTVSDTDQNFDRKALAKLDWMVCVDIFETEMAAFWKNPDVDPADIDTTVYLLPAASVLEQDGQRINSGRWAQWYWKGGNPPGDALPNTEITIRLGKKIRELYGASADPEDQPIVQLNWPCFEYVNGDAGQTLAEKISKELNGYWLTGPTTGVINKTGTQNDVGAVALTGNTTGLVDGFANLRATGYTACGNWLFCNSYVDPVNRDAFEVANTPGIWAAAVGNRMARRHSADLPYLGTNTGVAAGADEQYKNIGLHYYFAWCWPYNRRIVYNRASTYQNDGNAYRSDGSPAVQAGDPLAPNKHVIRYVSTLPVANRWKGDMADRTGDVGTIHPFIMTREGVGHLFGGWSVAEGPFPWHYEPAESPITYPSWLGAYRMNPTVHLYVGTVDNPIKFATHGDDTYPIVCTTYRFTEHYHTIMTRELPKLNQLQPEPMVEMSEELADDLAVNNGDLVRLTSIRGSIELKACVTKRFKPFTCEGETIHEVGLQWTWGFMALSQGPSANMLTPFIGDPNTRIMEYKACRIKIEKV